MRKFTFLLLFVLVFGLTACGGSGDTGGSADSDAGDAAKGKAIFEQKLIGAQAGCGTCHSLEPGITIVGPSLATIGADAGNRISGTSAEAYLKQSIMEPDAHVVDGFAVGTMPAALADELSAGQVSDLVAYLSTLK